MNNEQKIIEAACSGEQLSKVAERFGITERELDNILARACDREASYTDGNQPIYGMN